MDKLLDNIIIFLVCSFYLVSNESNIMTIMAICIAISLTCVNLCYQNIALNLLLYALFLLASLIDPSLLFFTPLICYKFFNTSYLYASFVSGLFLYYNKDQLSDYNYIALAIIFIISYLLKVRSDKYIDEKDFFENLQSELTNYNSTLNYKNHELLEKQDYEVTNARLNERNRIAREIHDSVGHILSSSILQIAALTAMEKDENIKSYLENINETLTNGMNSIRSSIHNIHDDSINLNIKITELVNGFNFCKINYEYEIDDDFTSKAKYTIIFIIKEALTNIIKHSNATEVNLSLSQTPAFYKVVIQDNGKVSKNTTSSSSGMGTISMYDRVSALNGTVNITKDNGYKIYITFPVIRKE